jgi:hypothetical protein
MVAVDAVIIEVLSCNNASMIAAAVLKKLEFVSETGQTRKFI